MQTASKLYDRITVADIPAVLVPLDDYRKAREIQNYTRGVLANDDTTDTEKVALIRALLEN